jgi:hypothetical protein
MNVNDENELALLRNQVEYFRRVFAYEARVIEAQCFDLKSLAKCRRDVLEDSVEALRHLALDEPTMRYNEVGAYNALDKLRQARDQA